MSILALHSDLHLELQAEPAGWLTPVPDILVLAGDITRMDLAGEYLLNLSRQFPDMQIIYVPGNHEYYHLNNMRESEKQLRQCLSITPNVHFLQCDTVDILGYRFIGCTGWSQMTGLGIDRQKEAANRVEGLINDFRVIGIDGHNLFTAENCIDLADEQYAWLQSVLEESKDSNVIVVTHFAPSLRVANPNFPVDEITSYFCASFDPLIEKFKPEMWLFGHTHANFDTRIGRTRVVSNQKGYGLECVESYHPEWFCELV